jgi:hypothetical protein
VKQEYLLATALLCVDLYTDLELEMSPADCKYPVDMQSRYRILDALRIARTIWEQESGESLEATKATGVLQLVLAKASTVEAAQNPSVEAASSSVSQILGEAESFAYGKVYNVHQNSIISNPCDFATDSSPSTFPTPEEADASEWETFFSAIPSHYDEWSNIKYTTPLVAPLGFVSNRHSFHGFLAHFTAECHSE